MTKCGIDIIEISRIQNAVQKNSRFPEKVFSAREIEYFRSHGCRFETLAGFFAAKEAFSKFLGCGISGHEFLRSTEILHGTSGAPYICFRGQQIRASVSISHNRTNAVAVVCGESLYFKDEHSTKMAQLLPKRADDANKGSCGRAFIVAGSTGMTGAAYLSARAALRSGSGLVTVATPSSEQCILACKLTEAMTLPLPCSNGIITRDSIPVILENITSANAAAIGPGLGKSDDIVLIVEELLKTYTGTLIIDADGINALSRNIDILKSKRCSVILTPHPGEMSRLAACPISQIQATREKTASEFARRYGVFVVLKGKDTVIAAPDGKPEINPTGNCGMATGGTGDVLTGVITAFAAQGAAPFDAAVLGTYIHGKAGDIAAEKKGIHGLIAGDVAEALPDAIMTLY